MPKESDAKWYVLHTYSGYENNVASNIARIVENRGLQDYVYETQIPLEAVSDDTAALEEESYEEPEEFEDDFEDEDEDAPKKRKVRRKKAPEEHKLLPSYVLIKMVMNEATRHIIRNVRGVTGFVGPDSTPVALTEEEIKNLGIASARKTFSVDYAVGDTVILVSGAMAGNTAVVKEIDPETGMVKATMLVGGKEAVVEFEASTAEPF